MKFDCGQTHQEKQEWHQWFAWFPVEVGPHDCRWLEYVERRGEFRLRLPMSSPWRWTYRAVEKAS
jgi:hypothetical protein